MKSHTKIYFDYFGYDVTDWIKCEMPECGSQSIDIHHVTPRSKFGSKRKAEQDHISNLIALCRVCHNLAHDGKISKDTLQEIISKRN